MSHFSLAPFAALVSVHVSFPQNASAIEQIVLRWLHIVAGIVWIGFLYFFNLVTTPVMQQMDGAGRSRVYATLISKAMWWFRWSSVVVWLVGFRYFMILAKDDATNIGNPSLVGKWLGIWFAVWVVAYVLLHGFLMMSNGPMKNGWVFAVACAVVVAAASWLVVDLITAAGAGAGNRTLSIAIGGGMGTVMFLLVWGIVWRCQKRLIGWHAAAAREGTPLPPEVAVVARRAYLASRLGFWLTFPLLFFMAASAHFPFLGQ